MASEISTQQEESGRRINPHDPKLAEIVTRVDYEMPAAIAELVDNSIDAHATNILIRLIRTEVGLRDLLVVDDGDGIADEHFDEAMRFARQRKYGDADTGMYGIGMKSSSLRFLLSLDLMSLT
jgi:signal transduction histidine kinase